MALTEENFKFQIPQEAFHQGQCFNETKHCDLVSSFRTLFPTLLLRKRYQRRRFQISCFSNLILKRISSETYLNFSLQERFSHKNLQHGLRPQFVDTLFIVRLRPNMSMRCAVMIIFQYTRLRQKISYHRQLTFCLMSNKVSLA